MEHRPRRREPEPLIDLSKKVRCHVVGVGGPGMSAVALLLAEMGHEVSGSDVTRSPVTDQLGRAGVSVRIGHDRSNVSDCDVVVYSTAIPVDNIELDEARMRGIEVRHRSGMLASICAAKVAVGVAGTHGKTTTSALLATMLRAGGLSPATIIGAELVGEGVGAEAGSGELLVIEADESDGTLDVLPLHHVVLTNVDVDHLDYFGSFAAVQESFEKVLGAVPGIVVANADDANSAGIISRWGDPARMSTFGTAESATVRVVHVEHGDDHLRIDVNVGGTMCVARLPLRGVHNAMNFAAALAMAWRLGVDPAVACSSVSTFRGVARRFTERGDHHGVHFVDDYAHLPAEIDATLVAARSHPRRTGRLVAVFQPNRFHRVEAMSGEYADCFSAADTVVITEIYASGTEPISGVSGIMIRDAIVGAHPHVDVRWAPERDDVVEVLGSLVAAGDVVVGMGCGDIETLADDFRRGAP